jgi:MerR family regulatory protein
VTQGRTYLSIGDVLTLLHQEFPDVTISKIRFLESQGLVNPERTPSGYRKTTTSSGSDGCFVNNVSTFCRSR